MKKWMVRVQDLMKSLGFESKVKEKAMSVEDWRQFDEEYQKLHGCSLAADKDADEPVESPVSAELQDEIFSMIGKAPASNQEAVKQVADFARDQKKTIDDQQKTIATLQGQPERTEGEPVGAVKISANAMTVVLGHAGHSEKYLFGIESPIFQRGNFYTELTVNRKVNELDEISSDQKKKFMGVFNDYVNSFASRYKELSTSGQINGLDFEKMMAGQSVIDYSSLTEIAGEYVTRRSDMIIAYLRSLPSIGHLFPTISNVQNKEVAPTVSFGELSQGYRKGKLFKGNVDFSAEIYSVADAMFKFEFDDMIELEKAYIGYLNKGEGSNIVKWSFIEWLITYFVRILMNERNRRSIVGIRTPQQDVTANPAMLAADGILRAIQRKEDEFKVLPFEDLTVYDDSTIVDYVETLWGYVSEILPTMDGQRLFMNAKHKLMYSQAFRAKYGKDTDFNGMASNMHDITPATIVWVPNMPVNCYKMWITTAGNICLLEDKPGEMSNFYFERDFESVYVISRWKEGSHIEVAGIAYGSRTELENSERQNQYIFTNSGASELPAGATSVDARKNSLFVTGENTAATAITGITGLSAERVIRIECGSATNATTIAKSGVFSEIGSVWSPKAVGDYIELYPQLVDETVTIDGKSVKRTISYVYLLL